MEPKSRLTRRTVSPSSKVPPPPPSDFGPILPLPSGFEPILPVAAPLPQPSALDIYSQSPLPPLVPRTPVVLPVSIFSAPSKTSKKSTPKISPSTTIPQLEAKYSYQTPRFYPTVFSFPRKDECRGDYEIKSKIGQGAYGKVFAACLGANCDYVLKEATVSDPVDLVSSKIDAIMLSSLQGEKWLNSRGELKQLVPVYHGSWTCPGKFVLVLDRWDGDMLKKGKKQYEAETKEDAGDNLLYTRDQIEDMFRIAQRLDELGIIHGDLKPDQYLHRGDDMVVTDLGMTSAFGWSSGSFDCPNPFIPAGGQVPPELREYFNQWQLSAILTNHYDTWVSGVVPGEWSKFNGMNFLPSSWKSAIESKCPKLPIAPATAKQFSISYVRGHSAADDELPGGGLMTLARLGELQTDFENGVITEEYFNEKVAQYLAQ